MSKLKCCVAWVLNRKAKSLSDIENGLAVALGSALFCISSYFGYGLSKLVPQLIDATNKYGVSWAILGLWLIVAFFAISVWVFGCVAARCHSTLYGRWFK